MPIIKKITVVNEAARAELGLSRDEYALCSYVLYRQADPRQKIRGYCCDTKDDIAGFIGLSRMGLHKMIGRLCAADLLEQEPESGYLCASEKFIDVENECKQSLQDEIEGVNKVYTKRKQSLRGDVNKVYAHNNELEGYKEGTNESMPASKKNKKNILVAPGRVAELMDKTLVQNGEEKYNWKANEGRLFKELRTISEMVQEQVQKKTPGAAPRDVELAIEYVFQYGWQYLQKIAAAKGGAVMMKPSSIINNLNEILKHAKANHKPASGQATDYTAKWGTAEL
jgi:hypothetical protein